MLKELGAVEAVATRGPAAIFDIVPGWMWAILCGLCVGWAVTNDVRVQHEKAALATAGQQFSDYRAQAEKDALELDSKYRELEQAFQRVKGMIDDQVEQERSKTAVAVRDGAATRSLLAAATEKLNQRASPGDPGALARAEERARAYGQLLSTCDAVAESLGRDSENLGTQVRGLQAQYRSLTPVRVGLGLSPLTNGDGVHPHAGTWRVGVVDATRPVLALDPALDGDAGLARE